MAAHMPNWLPFESTTHKSNKGSTLVRCRNNPVDWIHPGISGALEKEKEFEVRTNAQKVRVIFLELHSSILVVDGIIVTNSTHIDDEQVSPSKI